MKKIINCETGEVVERELTDDELTQQEVDNAQALAIKEMQMSKAEADAQAKAALLERLGITEDEAKLLLA